MHEEGGDRQATLDAPLPCRRSAPSVSRGAPPMRRPANPPAKNAASSGPSRLRELVGRVARGDEPAFAELFDATRALVHGTTRLILDDAPAAEEATLDVYLQVWREAKRFDERRGTVVSWLSNLARSRAIDRLRVAGGAARRLERPLESAAHRESDGAPPLEASWIGERRARVAAALAHLTSDQQQAIRCAFFLGMSHSEVAAHLREPLGTVKTRIRTGLLRLRDHLRSFEALA
jgi:RNA polymerase sigma-70 factor (ECF subfamily)